MKLKLKYYLRGLGLGIVITTVIMSIAAAKEHKLTNEEIIARAKQLGMIESTVLTEGADREAGEDEDKQSDDNGQPDDSGQSGDVAALSKVSAAELDTHTDVQPDVQPSSEVSELDVQADSEASKPDAQPSSSVSNMDIQSDAQVDGGVSKSGVQPDSDVSEPETETTSAFPKVIVVSHGESSYTVSKRLAEIGAVESASDFDTYLCEHGYDKKIRAGTYTIPVGATNEQMAKIVTGAKTE